MINFEEIWDRRDRWIEIGLRGPKAPFDTVKLAQLARRAYRQAGLADPLVLFFGSPRAGAAAAEDLFRQGAVSVRGTVFFKQINTSSITIKDTKLQDQIISAWRDSRDWYKISDQIDFIEEIFYRNPEAPMMGPRCRGYQSAKMLGFDELLNDLADEGLVATEIPKKTSNRAILIELAKNCGWWWALNDTVILTRPPIEVNLNEENELRGQPALRFADGWEIWANEGLAIEEPEPVEIVSMDRFRHF